MSALKRPKVTFLRYEISISDILCTCGYNVALMF